MSNLPDDWGCYFSTCDRCKKRYHDSEGGCDCLEDHVACAGAQECWVHYQVAIMAPDGKEYCHKHEPEEGE